MAGRGGDGAVVGQVGEACGCGAAMGVEDQREAEGLRRLRGAQHARSGVATTRPAASICFTVSASGAPGTAAPKRSAAATARAISAGVGNDARAVMDEDDVGRGGGLRLQPGENALLPAVAAKGGRPEGGRRSGRQARRARPDRARGRRDG